MSLLALLEPARIRFVSGSILVLSLILLVLSFASAWEGGRTRFGPTLGADYAEFFTAGYMLDHYPPAQLYDESLQDKVLHELHPQFPQNETLPFVYPPFVAWAFLPLSRLPYTWSFAIWLGISLGLYLAGIWLLTRLQSSAPPALTDRLTVFLLMLSFEPFVMECWLGGQLSAFGFCSLAAFLALDRSGRPLLAGLALGLCFYKPTFLVLLLPVLLMALQFWILLGVTLTGIGLALLTWAAMGTETLEASLQALLGFGQGSTRRRELEGPTWKFVDLNAFTRLLLGPSWPQRLLLLVLALPPLGLLLWRAWQVRHEDRDGRLALLAITILATPVLNLYVCIYDSILAALGALVLVGLWTRSGAVLPPRLQIWLVALYVVPWFAQPLARGLHLQLLTIVLFGLTVDLLLLIRHPPWAGSHEE